MKIFLTVLAMSSLLVGCCCPEQSVESEEKQYRTYLEKFTSFEDGDDIGRRDKKWLRKKRKQFVSDHKKLPSGEAKRLAALSELTGRMQTVALEARDRSDARSEVTSVPPEKLYLGLAKQGDAIVGKSKKFDTDEIDVWMVYRTKKHPKKGVSPTVKWTRKNDKGKYVELFSVTADNMLTGDEGVLTIHSNLYREPDKLKAWPDASMGVEVWYGKKRVKKGKFAFVDR